MATLNEEIYGRKHRRLDVTTDKLREKTMEHTKLFKSSWVQLGQSLYAIYKDKFFLSWGYDKFEYYTQKELGLKNSTAIKLLKTYFFLEQEEPSYLAKEYVENAVPTQVPNYEAVNLLRLAKGKKELDEADYHNLKRDIFEKGKDITAVRKDLTTMIKERQEVDPDEARDERNVIAIRKFVNALRSFKKDAETLKLVSPDVLEETERLLKKLEKETQR